MNLFIQMDDESDSVAIFFLDLDLAIKHKLSPDTLIFTQRERKLYINFFFSFLLKISVIVKLQFSRTLRIFSKPYLSILGEIALIKQAHKKKWPVLKY